MAEYAGLEIRIGGNTTKLTNALKASTKSAAELQNRIRQATRAMQFDPTDLKNVETRIKLTGDRMQSLQSKAQLARTAMQQLGDSVVTLDGKSRSVREVASETENLSLKAKQADERFNNLTGTLAKIYEAWNKVARTKGADSLMDQLGFTQAEANHLMSSTTTLRDFEAELHRVQEERSSLGYNGGKPLISDADIENIKRFKELNFHDMFKRGLELDDVIADAKELGIVLEDSAIENVRELQKTFKDAQRDKEAFDKALKFEQMGTDLQRINSETESLSQTMRKLDDGMTVATSSGAFQGLESRVRTIDSALDNVNHDLERTREAMKVDPGNIELAARYFNDLQQKSALSEEKVELLNREMRLLNVNGVTDAAKGHQDLAKWVEESAEAARKAHKELSEVRAETANLEDQTAQLSQTIATMKGDSTLASYSDNVLEWQKRTERLNSAMKELATEEGNVANEQKKLADAQAAFDKAESDAKQYETQLESLRREYEQLDAAATQAFDNGEVVDQSMLDYMSGLQIAIERLETSYDGAATNAAEFGKKLREQQERTSAAEGALERQKGAVDDLKQSVDELAQTREVKLFQNPTGEIEAAEQELVELRGEADKAKAKMNELEAAYDSAKAENELAKTAQAIRDVSQDADKAKATLKKVAQELDIKGDSILNPSTIKSLGMTMSATLTPAITAIGYKMVDASSTVDTAYRDMRKTVNGTEEQFEHLRSAAIEFSRTHVTSADQILQIEAIGGELGVATDSLQTFAEVISNINVATNLDTEGAAEALGHLSNILHLTEDDYVGFSDALVRLGNNGASTETEIANIAERIGSMGSIVGMSGSDILAWSSTIASTGQNAEAAGTAISRTMSFMETAVASAGGTLDTSFESINAAVQEGGDRLTLFASLAGMTAEDFAQSWETSSEEMAESLNEQLDSAKDSLQMIADVAHMSADEFAKTWESDPTEAMKAFINGLNDLEASGGSADKVLSDLGITAVRQKQAIEGLMQTVGGLDDNLQMSEDAWNGVSDKWGQAGDAANEAAKKAEGFSGQIQILKNMGQIFLSELGDGAVPIIKMFSGQLEWLSGTFSSLGTEAKTTIVALGGIAALSGPVISIAGTFLTATKEIKEWRDTAVSGMSFVKLAFKQGGQEAVDALLGSMSAMEKTKLIAAELGTSLLKGLAAGAVVAAIGIIITCLKELYDQYQDHIAATKGLSDALDGIGVAADGTVDSFSSVSSSLDELAADAGAYESRLADLSRTIEDSNSQYGAFAGSMDYYADSIRELGGKANLTKEEAYKLEAALMAVNDACGTTYALDEFGNIIDTETGKVQENTDAILANIEARKQQALVDYYADDYQKAVGEWAEAQDKLNDAQAKYNDLISGAGHDKFIKDQQERLGNNVKLSDIETQYAQAVQRSKDAMDNYQKEMDATSAVVDKLEGKLSAAEQKQREANKTLKDAAKTQDDYNRRVEKVTADVTGNMKRMSDAIDELGGDDSGFNAIADGLEAIHVTANELNDVDMSALVSAFSDANSSMSDVIATLEAGGVHMDTWNAALEQAPGAAENMGSVTAAAFQSMYEIAGNSIDGTMTLIAGLDMVQVGDKTFYVGDNGSVLDEQGRVYDLKSDLDSIPPEVATVLHLDNSDAQQKATDSENKLVEVGKQTPTPTINVNDYASAKVSSVQGKVDRLGSSKATPIASVIDYASGVISSISSRLRSLDGSGATVTITTVERTVKQATGGMNNRPVIPRHASGYIATGPTLTNQGWIGEDGVEAVANWATGGAVVPLTNKKYMLPIADAIAEGMASRGVGGGVTYNAYIDGAKVNADDDIQAAILNFFDVLVRKGALNVG